MLIILVCLNFQKKELTEIFSIFWPALVLFLIFNFHIWKNQVD